MATDEELNLLASLPVLSQLNENQKKQLLESSHHLKLSKGQTLFNMGDVADSFYLLKKGQLKIARNSIQGMEKVLEIVAPGHLFAEAVMFLSKRCYPVNCVALKKSEVIGFNNKLFISYLHESTELSMALLGDLSQRLHKKVIEIDSLTLQNATIRLINYLNTLIVSSNINSTTIELDAPKQTIASIISVTPETFSRILKQLEDEKLLTLKKDSIFIPDIKKLTEHSYYDQT